MLTSDDAWFFAITVILALMGTRVGSVGRRLDSVLSRRASR